MPDLEAWSPEGILAALGDVGSRAPFPYVTSWPIEEITVARPDGPDLSLLLKRYDGADMRSGPTSVRDWRREATVYRLLEAVAVEVPRCFAAGERWLLLERVPGLPLWQVGELAAWRQAARWLACLHASFAASPPEPASLLVREAGFFRSWFDRALDQGSVTGDPSGLAIALERAVARLQALPMTLIHGEAYPFNLLVDGDRVTAVDWEMAGLGPGVIDLAALVTGWPDEAQALMIDAYGPVDHADLAAAKLVLALQWMGWDNAWNAPPEHAHDWRAEAEAAAEVLR